MESISFDKKDEIICMIEKLLDNGYDEIDVNNLIELYKANKKQDVVD